MKIIRNADFSFIPASHENPQKPGVLKKVLITRDDIASGRVQMINWARLPKGESFQPHYHESMTEIFIIITGMVEIRVNKEVERLSAKDAVIVQSSEVHHMKNISDADVEYIVIGIAHAEGGKTVVVS